LTDNENKTNYSFHKRRIYIKDCRNILLMSVKNRELAVEAAARQWLQKTPGEEGYIELGSKLSSLGQDPPLPA
jgi:hypothetical protein